MPRPSRSSGTPGADPSSSVQKACSILRVMSDARNARLTDIALAAGLDKATALRLLDVLLRNGFVVRNPVNKRYSLGPEIFTLGAAAVSRNDPRALARASLIRLVRAFEDTAILSIPRGAESVCVDVQAGTYAIRANYLEVGSRRPLGIGAGSLALLAFLPDDEIASLMPLIADRFDRYPRYSERFLMQQIEQARRRGYAVLYDVVVDRMGGIGVPIMGDDGRPAAALSIAALSDRISSREQAMADALRQEAALCEQNWQRPAGGRDPLTNGQDD